MNPVLPLTYFVPDVEARVYGDRLYFYGSRDISGNNKYCSYDLEVFSTTDLRQFTAHGKCFSSYGPKRDTERQTPLYAPDSILGPDGRYYLYYCQSDATEGVAVGDKPEGPFKHIGYVPIANGDFIDPAVFIDDDGTGYYYWGQHTAKGARLNPDMVTLDEAGINDCLLTEVKDGFHEGSSMRKIGGLYYFVYTDISRGNASCLSYAVSRNPLGPFEKGGVIIDNDGCVIIEADVRTIGSTNFLFRPNNNRF